MSRTSGSGLEGVDGRTWLSRDGNYLFSGSGEWFCGQLWRWSNRKWQMSRDELEFSEEGNHSFRYSHIAMSAQGDRILIVGEDGVAIQERDLAL